MRSALLFVLFTVVIKRPGLWAADDFRPTPIPLDYWNEERAARSKPVEDPPVVAVPAHYWEDALRHSVYLTLVRDKIDQLIAKGEVIHPDSKPEHTSREVDDHDLWDKIKYAPFDRLPEEESNNPADVTIMARGRLVEEGSGYRFSEDEKNKEKCLNDTCAEGVKAFWSVKRTRQREGETTPGKYHYELTFSVVTQQPKQKVKPYENPARTFTVKETAPSTIVDKPLEHPQPLPPTKDGRTLWVHKNIVPKQRFHSRQYQNGLDRFFSSLFDDDDDDVPRRPKTTYVPQSYNQYSKVGYVNSPSESHQHKKLIPYPYKQHSIKYSRPPPPPQPPLSHTPHYLDTDSIGVVSNHYMPQYPDGKYPDGRPHQGQRPLPQQSPNQDNSTTEGPTTENRRPEYAPTTDVPEIITGYHKHRPRPYKVSYYNPEHVRPPVFNAPPGVFVTMDKKPFKPMPPLRLHTKPIKAHKPTDFRPSPQLLDMHGFSEPDPSFDTAFRPINIKYEGNGNGSYSAGPSSTETVQVAESSNKPKDNVLRKWNATETKTTNKKHENKKAPKFTTTAPEIITAQSYDDDTDSMHWANLLGAFSKTTPMGAHKDKSKDTDTTTPMPTTTSTTTVRPTVRVTTTTEEATTTSAPKPKRTRPPPKFEQPKPVKAKKHKRVTTTTTTTTEAPSTEKPISRRPVSDLLTQASSAPTNKPKKWTPSSTSQPEPENEETTTTTKKPITTTTTTSTTTTTTTDRSVISSFTTQKPTTTPKPKNKNRYRQSTLMQKGTSVNHDKWSPSNVAESSNKPRTVLPPTGSFPKRKGSNFQGYQKPTTSRPTEYYDYDDHHSPPKVISSTARISTKPPVQKTTQATYEDTVDKYDAVKQYASEVHSSLLVDDSEEEDEDDQPEYTFQRKTTTNPPSERNNEIYQNEGSTTEKIIVTSPYSAAKNKTKCKKKINSTTVSSSEIDFEEEQLLTTLPTPASPNESQSAPDIFDDLFGGFTLDDVTSTTEASSGEELDNEASENHEELTKADEDFEDFLDEIDGKHADARSEDSFYPEDESERDGLPSFDEEEDRESPRGTDYDDIEESPFSLLELMAME